MLVLALDTTTRQGSAALVRDGRLVASLAGDPTRTHAERLPGDLVRLLDEAGLCLRDVDVFGVAAGPGSFTGLRVGIAAIQGLAFALGRKVVPIPVLDVLAQIGAGWDGFDAPHPHPAGTLVGVVMDAQRREVFSALFRVATPPRDPAPRTAAVGSESPVEPALLDVVEAPAAEPPGITAARWHSQAAASPMVLAGDGALLYLPLFEEHLGSGLLVCRPLPALAPVIGAVAGRRALAGGAVSPHAIKPIYVRRPDAELARDRRTAGQQATAQPERP